MALINCVECGKEVSSLAAACPNCGCPIACNAASEPKLPSNLMVYGSVSLFGFTPASISGKISHSCTIPGIRLGGQVGISRLKEGLYITGLSKDLLQVHYSQLVSAHFVEAVKVKQQGKSVIGRAAVGAVLLGPFGAIIGGMSGMGKNEKVVDGISLTYWHVGAKRYDTLLVESGTNSLSGFCTLLAKECAPFEAIHLEARL